MHFEAFILLGIYHGAYQIRRQQIRSELNPAEFSIYGLRQCTDRQCFRQSRDTFEQDVPVSQQSNQQIFHERFLPDDHLAHFHGQHVDESALLLNPVVQFFDVNAFHIS